MSQGNDAKHLGDDGIWEDGGLLFQFPGQEQWVGIFLAVPVAGLTSDNVTGHAITIATSGPPSDSMPGIDLDQTPYPLAIGLMG